MDSAGKIDLIAEAKEFAVSHQRNRLWSYTGEPISVHLEAVARLVGSVPGATPEMVAAAWLHDVVDDQEVHLGQIREAFGDQVAGLVGELTDPASLEEGDRHRHAEINRLHAAMASREAHTVNLADLVDSVRAMLEYHPNGSTTYMDEARELLLAIKGDPGLWELAWGQVTTFFSRYHGRVLSRS